MLNEPRKQDGDRIISQKKITVVEEVVDVVVEVGCEIGTKFSNEEHSTDQVMSTTNIRK